MTLVTPVALAWASVVASVSLFALLRAWAFARRPGAASLRYRPRAVMVRPCAGHEPWLEHTLCSVMHARCRERMAVRLAVGSADDAALPAARRAVDVLTTAGWDASVVLTDAQGPNHKSAQIARVLAHEEPTFVVVIVADSDVDLTDVDLDALVAPLEDPSVGVSWAPPVEAMGSTLADGASAAVLGASLHAFALLAGIDRGCLVGKLMALRADTLRSVGGFDDLTHHLGEDMELSRRIRRRDGRVVPVPLLARSQIKGRTWSVVIARYARWLAVIRSQRPALLLSYPLLFAATPWIVALSLIGCRHDPRVALAAITLTLVARLVVAMTAMRLAGLRGNALMLSALSEFVLTVAFVRAVSTRKLTWRGRALTLQAGGTLREISR